MSTSPHDRPGPGPDSIPSRPREQPAPPTPPTPPALSRVHLQEEIRQRRPFRSPSQEAVLGLLRTADLLRHELGQVIERHGITMQQYNVLRILRGAGEDGLPTLAIAERMIERAPGITRIVDRLEHSGLVTRTRSQEDRRQVVCRITPAGLELLATLDPDVDESDDRILEMLSEAEQRELIRVLEKVRGAYREGGKADGR